MSKGRKAVKRVDYVKPAPKLAVSRKQRQQARKGKGK